MSDIAFKNLCIALPLDLHWKVNSLVYKDNIELLVKAVMQNDICIFKRDIYPIKQQIDVSEIWYYVSKMNRMSIARLLVRNNTPCEPHDFVVMVRSGNLELTTWVYQECPLWGMESSMISAAIYSNNIEMIMWVMTTFEVSPDEIDFVALASDNKTAILEFFIENDATENLTNDAFSIMLEFAAKKEHLDILKILNKEFDFDYDDKMWVKNNTNSQEILNWLNSI